jgi:hypothetical protein
MKRPKEDYRQVVASWRAKSTAQFDFANPDAKSKKNTKAPAKGH